MLRIGACNIDIPAGARHHAVEDQYTLPIDVDVHTRAPRLVRLALVALGATGCGTLDALRNPLPTPDIPDDFPQTIGLTRAVSPLRIAGMTGMLLRAKRQVRAKLAA